MWVRATDGTLLNMNSVFTVGIERRESDGTWMVVAQLVPECRGISYGSAIVLHDGLTRAGADARLTDVFRHLGPRNLDLVGRSSTRTKHGPALFERGVTTVHD